MGEGGCWPKFHPFFFIILQMTTSLMNELVNINLTIQFSFGPPFYFLSFPFLPQIFCSLWPQLGLSSVSLILSLGGKRPSLKRWWWEFSSILSWSERSVREGKMKPFHSSSFLSSSWWRTRGAPPWLKWNSGEKRCSCKATWNYF